jgi:hypothetical protein
VAVRRGDFDTCEDEELAGVIALRVVDGALHVHVRVVVRDRDNP